MVTHISWTNHLLIKSGCKIDEQIMVCRRMIDQSNHKTGLHMGFNNFCSFNIESEFSMEAPTGKVKTRFPDNYTSTDAEYDLLKTAVIVGENAGGKSNFIGSLKFLKSLVDVNSPVQSVGAYVNVTSQIFSGHR